MRKGKRPKPTKNGNSSKPEEHLARRRILKLLAGTAAAAATTPFWVWLADSFSSGQSHSTEPVTYDRWGFLGKIDPTDYTVDLYELTLAQRANYVQLDAVNPMSPDSQALKESKPVANLLLNQAREKGWKNPVVNFTETRYGQVDRPSRSRAYAEYIALAGEFLFEKLPRLPRERMDGVILKPGDDYSRNAKGKAFIGLVYHTVRRVTVADRDTGEGILKEQYSASAGSITVMDRTAQSDKPDYFIFFGLGSSAVQSTFSELIPVATRRTVREHFKTAGLERSVTAAEAISEGLSYLLAQELVEKLGIPGGQELLDKPVSAAHDKRYRYVPQSIAWLRKNGMQKGLDIYMQNPERFMKLIKS